MARQYGWQIAIGALLVASVALFGGLIVAGTAPATAGTGKATVAATPGKTGKTPAPSAATLAAGRRAFIAVGCVGCHALAAAGSKTGVGPSLNHIGKLRDAAWIVVQIHDPCAPGHQNAAGSNYTCTVMPQDLAKGKTAAAIAAFLASQK